MNSKALYLRLLTYVRPYWKGFGVAVAAMVVLAAVEPTIAALFKPLLDVTFVEKDPESIKLVPFALIGLFIVRGSAGFLSEVGMGWVATRVVYDLRRQMFDRLMTLPIRYFDEYKSGALMSKLLYDANNVTNAATQALVVIIKDSLTVLGLLGYIFYLNWKLALVTLMIVPAIALIVTRVGRRLRSLSHGMQANVGEMTSVVQEAIEGVKIVRVFGGIEYEQKRFDHVANWVRRMQMKKSVAANASVPVVQVFTAIALAIVAYVASVEATTGTLTVGGFVSFIAAMALLFSPIKRLTNVNEPLQRGLAAAESVFHLIDLPYEPHAALTAPVARARGELEFDHLSFRYPTADCDALNHIDLRIEAGETIALVGASGSGKSTLVSLLPMFYAYDRGRILLDGRDLRDIPIAELRAQISWVGQEVLLFNDTVAANIAYGALRDASAEDIAAAASAAHAMEFIERLPDGMQTVIGEKGARLSGGQRQRLAIARAILKDAPVLILDEATSALDTQSEHQVQAALETVKQGRTTIIVAHRLSTIENADRIVVLDAGRIVEIGNHQALLDRGEAYAALYRRQFDAN
ncbi:MAG: lipid A export permease/ATP-binding protein MsbA [Zoogloeaceae bacterium]|nr:lipid A export permease/ATP-binding protein MsbA [Gammaproteobacteria bacterium]MCP5230842.1 lipid A export permease/ATP-binding protein MsbA [Zoogloeaceae bacterium]